MPKNNALKANIVDPNTKKNARMKNDSPMLMLDSHLMPLPTPDSAESVEKTITITRQKIIATAVGDPSASINQPMPVMLNKPAANCDTP